MTSKCEHHNFSADVKIGRLEDVGRFCAELRVNCTDCGTPMQFIGLPGGLSHKFPTTSIDGLELRVPICPEGEAPSLLDEITAATSTTH